MNIELILSGANLFALVAFVIRLENRITRLETLLEMTRSARP